MCLPVSSWVEHLMRLRLVGVSAEYVASVTGKVGAHAGGACTLLGPEGPGADRVSFLELVVVGGCFLEGLFLLSPVGGCGGGVPPVL